MTCPPPPTPYTYVQDCSSVGRLCLPGLTPPPSLPVATSLLSMSMRPVGIIDPDPDPEPTCLSLMNQSLDPGQQTAAAPVSRPPSLPCYHVPSPTVIMEFEKHPATIIVQPYRICTAVSVYRMFKVVIRKYATPCTVNSSSSGHGHHTDGRMAGLANRHTGHKQPHAR